MKLFKTCAEAIAFIWALVMVFLFLFMIEPAHASTGDDVTGTGMLTILLVIYFIPWMVALARKAKGTGGIAVINLFLGWTLLGWVGALAWAAAAEKRD